MRSHKSETVMRLSIYVIALEAMRFWSLDWVNGHQCKISRRGLRHRTSAVLKLIVFTPLISKIGICYCWGQQL